MDLENPYKILMVFQERIWYDYPQTKDLNQDSSRFPPIQSNQPSLKTDKPENINYNLL